MSDVLDRWKRCSTCKQAIGFDAEYWTCSVSTCNRPRTGLQFCSVSCWDAHVPILRHRDAGAIEGRSPSRVEHARTEAPPLAALRPPTRSDTTHLRSSAPVGAQRAATPPATLARPSADRSPVALTPHGDTGMVEEPPREILVVVSKLKAYVRARSGFNTSDRCMELLSDHVRALCDRAIESARAHERRTLLERDIPDV